MTPEFSRVYAGDTIGSVPRTVEIDANAAERERLAARFGLVRLDALSATATLVAVAGGFDARGSIRATAVQSCVVSGDPVPVALVEPFALRFAEAAPVGEEVELGEHELDVLPLEGGAIDLGEAVAQTLGLALDPFPRAPGMDGESSWTAGPDASPFAALKDLKI